VAIASETRTVVGVFNSVQDAQSAVRDLEAQGISRDEISIVANKNAVGYDTMDSADRDKASDVVADAGIGAAIGGVGGLLLSAAGALTIPVIGPILAAGPIAAALTGAGIGAAAGGLIGALTESGVPEEHARYYAEGVRRGDVLVTVRTDIGRTDQVCDVLDAHNAVDVDDRVRNWRDRGWDGYRDDEKPFDSEELRRERSYYSAGTLTGATGIAVDRERSSLHRDRDDLSPRVGNTPASNYAGDVGTSGVVGTTGMTSAGLGTGHSTPEVTGDRGWDTSETRRRGDDRSVTEKIGDKMHEWKEDVKDTGRDLRDEARENRRTMGEWADETRGTYGSTSDTASEAGRDLKEAGRDVNDVLHGRTGKQPHDRMEDRREALRDSSSRSGSSYSSGQGTRSGMSDMMDEAGRDLKEAGRDVNDVLHGRTGEQPHDRMEDRREAERRRRSRVYDRTIL
jgi:hypothetical protein